MDGAMIADERPNNLRYRHLPVIPTTDEVSMKLQRYAVYEHDHFETGDMSAWCKGDDVAELEARVAEIEAEIEAEI